MHRRLRPSPTRLVFVAVFVASLVGGGAGASRAAPTQDWQPMPAGPLSARTGATAIWTGRELIVWGGATWGGRGFADGAAYDPIGRRWHRIARAPIGGREGQSAEWTGREMIVFGGWNRRSGEAADLAAYDPDENRWRRLPDWRPRWQNAAAWTGQSLMVWGGDGGEDYVADGAAFAPRTERWTALPRGPLGPRTNPAAVWTGRELIVLGGASYRPLRL